MKPLDIKICGLSTAPTVAAALDGGATHLGFIFFPKSPRNVSPDKARDLGSAAAGRAVTVAVTVDADNALLDAIVKTMKPGMLQLHGKENPGRVAELKARYGLPVMKAFSVRDAADLEALSPYLGVADRFLLDAKPPAGADLPGGNGVSFDWSLLAGLDGGVDYMLSGGIGSGNVAEAILATSAAGIDASSGVESAPGVKDEGKIEEFLRLARQAEQERAIAHQD